MKINIGQRMRYLREKMDIPQNEVADALKIPQVKLSKIENNWTKNVDIFLLQDFCNICGITLDDFLKLENMDDEKEVYMKKINAKCSTLSVPQLKNLLNFINTFLKQ